MITAKDDGVRSMRCGPERELIDAGQPDVMARGNGRCATRQVLGVAARVVIVGPAFAEASTPRPSRPSRLPL
ncbi:MAG: hypothetical protein EON96_08615 [Caulobacteraceae bacterium]|nr:MAG: hypothetical protein EON96_08615 [Caulobacteraceae bacterium]